jgi:long-chain acyl-CoA synthetase
MNTVSIADEEIASLPRRAAEAFGSRPALVFATRRWTFERLYECISAVVRRIATRASHGERVIVIAPNSDQAVIAILGTLTAGAVAVPLQVDTRASRLRAILEDCAPALVLCDVPRLDNMCEWGGPVETLDAICATPWNGRFEPERPVDPADTAVILYTSGSTGIARGVACPHRQVAFCTTAINRVVGNTDSDVILSSRPLSFVYGFHQVLLALSAGSTLIIYRDMSMASLARTVIDEHVTGLPLAPSLIAALLHSRVLERVALRSVRYITSTGDTLPPAHIRTLRAALPDVAVMPMYGLTECGRVSVMPAGMLEGREESVGLPVPKTGVRIVGNSGRAVATGEAGELLVHGPHLSGGYWRNRQLTGERFVVDDETGVRELHTGDLFKRDAEGFLYFVSRANTMIKNYGELVSPTEVESVVGEFPGVAETIVVGVPSQSAGETVVAFVLSDGTRLDVERLRQHCAAPNGRREVNARRCHIRTIAAHR